MNCAQSLFQRQLTGRGVRIKEWAENASTKQHHATYVNLEAPRTRSTIAIDFSPDGLTFASTHGDHTVKISNASTGKVLQELVGHPRTPWTVKYHPTDPMVVASGCLGKQVRVWNVCAGTCMYQAFLESCIISLSFHPAGDILAVASGQYVHLWRYKVEKLPRLEWSHKHTLRGVCFVRGGTSLVVGGSNESAGLALINMAQIVAPRHPPEAWMPWPGGGAPAPRKEQHNFRLSLWDFDVKAARLGLPAMTAPRTILSRALLYNDGGFDVSSCGKYLCACAEFLVSADGQPSFGKEALATGTKRPKPPTAPTTPASSSSPRTPDPSVHRCWPRRTSGLRVRRGAPTHTLSINTSHHYRASGMEVEDTEDHRPGGWGGGRNRGGARHVYKTPDGGSLARHRQLRATTRSTGSPSITRGAHSPQQQHPGPSPTDSPSQGQKRHLRGPGRRARAGHDSLGSESDGSEEEHQHGSRKAPRDSASSTPTRASPGARPREPWRSPPGGGGSSSPRPPPVLRPHGMRPVPRRSRLCEVVPNVPEEGEQELGQQGEAPRLDGREAFQTPPARQFQGQGNGTPESGGPPWGGRGGRGGWGALEASPPPPPPPHYEPFLVLVSLDLPLQRGTREEDQPQARVLRAAAFGPGFSAKEVTSIKLSPSSSYILVGRGVRETPRFQPWARLLGDPPVPEHAVVSFFRVRDMCITNYRPTELDDVNIARFHPEQGFGCVYGTKTGRVCMMQLSSSRTEIPSSH